MLPPNKVVGLFALVFAISIITILAIGYGWDGFSAFVEVPAGEQYIKSCPGRCRDMGYKTGECDGSCTSSQQEAGRMGCGRIFNKECCCIPYTSTDCAKKDASGRYYINNGGICKKPWCDYQIGFCKYGYIKKCSGGTCQQKSYAAACRGENCEHCLGFGMCVARKCDSYSKCTLKLAPNEWDEYLQFPCNHINCP